MIKSFLHNSIFTTDKACIKKTTEPLLIVCVFIFYLLIKFQFIILFYRQFRICFTKDSGKAHTPKVTRIPRLSLWESSRDSG